MGGEARDGGVAGPLFLAQRDRFHTAYRLSFRVAESLMGFRAHGLRSPRARQQAARIPIDLVIGYFLRRSRRMALLPRLALDALDVGTSSVMQGNTYDGATQLGIPLALEAGIRHGVAGLVVPAVNLMGTATIRRRRGLRIKPATMGWQVLAVAGGMAVRSLLDHERRVVQNRHEAVMAARCSQATLAGQNDVAVGADTVVDLLIRTAPILQRPGESGSPVQLMLSSWKETVVNATATQATYLRTALLQWRRRHNLHPDLSRDVDFTLAPEDGTVLLSAGQVSELEVHLDGMELRGDVAVRIVDREQARRPGWERRLFVGECEICLAPDRSVMAPRLDLGPAALWFGALLCALTVLPSQGRVPWRRAIISFGWFAASGFWAQRRVRRLGPQAHERIFLASVVGSFLHALMTTPWHPDPVDQNGWVPQSYLLPLVSEIALAYIYADQLGRSTRRIGAIASVTGAVVGYRLSEATPKDLVLNLTAVVAAMITFRGLAEAIEAEMNAYGAKRQVTDSALIERAFRAGQRQVIDLVSQAHERLWGSLEASGEWLDHADQEEVGRRLVKMAQQLSRLRRGWLPSHEVQRRLEPTGAGN